MPDAVYIGVRPSACAPRQKIFPERICGKVFVMRMPMGYGFHVTANILALQPGSRRYAGIFSGVKEYKPGCAYHCRSGRFRHWQSESVRRLNSCEHPANNTNYLTYLFWHAQGAKRVVSARGTFPGRDPTDQENIPADMEIESFITVPCVFPILAVAS